ncbi:MAG: endonuclease/exonuclease/phosphatase family protein [bacterium]|nr:endonuclease/exonuclease/phosphatase family protein [bacterium]
MIANSGADIVLVQEAGPLMARERGRLLKAFPYQSACTNQRCELAILSRFPMTTPRYRFRDAAGRQFGVGLLTARITFPGGRAVRVATLHLPRLTKWPDGGQYLRQRLAATVGLVADPGLIIGGDFNQVPWSFALQQLDEQMWPMTRVTRATPSDPASIGGKQTVALLPIDHIYAGPLWRARKAWVLPYAGSDHRPVMAELSWASR